MLVFASTYLSAQHAHTQLLHVGRKQAQSSSPSDDAEAALTAELLSPETAELTTPLPPLQHVLQQQVWTTSTDRRLCSCSTRSAVAQRSLH